jgi:hypothetical protein
MYYIARLSGGTASAVATDRAIARYGRQKVLICFGDVRWEDEDSYRFLRECMARWGGRLYTLTEGRTPLEVAEAKQLIPNSAMAPCSYELKIQPFSDWLWRLPKPTTILSGLSWAEPQRINRLFHYHRHAGKWRAPMGFARRVPGVYEDFPLLWKPLEYRPYTEVVRSWGVEPPRMYSYGFHHGNCGGRCIRQGVEEFHRLYIVWPERFWEVADWETRNQGKGGARAKATICRVTINGVLTPISLRDLAAQWQKEACGALPLLEYTDDRSECTCTG